MALIPDVAVDRMTELSASAWRLYCVLARHRNQKTGRCFPSVQTSAEAIGVHPRNIFKLRKELTAAGWAVFDGNEVKLLFGFDSVKNTTTFVDNTELAGNSGENASGNFTTGENATKKWRKRQSNSGENASDIKEEPAKANQQIEPCAKQQESRFPDEQIRAYIKATKKHAYSVSGLARYLQQNGDEDDQIGEWIEAQELRATLKAQSVAIDQEGYSMDDCITDYIAADDRAHLEQERRYILNRGGPTEPWEFRVFDYFNNQQPAKGGQDADSSIYG